MDIYIYIYILAVQTRAFPLQIIVLLNAHSCYYSSMDKKEMFVDISRVHISRVSPARLDNSPEHIALESILE